jgi:hypothetical protein
MVELRGIETTKASWVQPEASEQRFELRSHDALLATLTFRSQFGTLAVAETSSGTWTYKRVGFLNPRITVRTPGDDHDLAIYHAKFWGGGALVFADGTSLLWQSTNFWATTWAFTSGGSEPVVGFRPGVEDEKLRDLFKTQATIEIPSASLRHERMPLLVTLGMYLLILHRQDGAAAATIAAVG